MDSFAKDPLLCQIFGQDFLDILFLGLSYLSCAGLWSTGVSFAIFSCSRLTNYALVMVIDSGLY
jgi:hypothetical protein